MICSVLKNLVAPTSTWNTAVGSNIYIGEVPSSHTLPYVAIYPISRVEMDEASVCSERIQFTCCSTSMSSAASIAETIMSKVKLFAGASTYFPGIFVHKVYYDNMAYMYDYSNKGHSQMLDFIIKYKR